MFNMEAGVMSEISKLGSVVGIDIGGTKVCIGLVSPEGVLECSERYATKHGAYTEFSTSLLRYVYCFFDKYPHAREAQGIGIGIKGFVDYGKQLLNRSSIISADGPIDLCGLISNEFSLPVIIDNDVHAAAIAEMRLGVGRFTGNFVFLNLGTGAAIGVVDDYRLVRGKTNRAGEIGLSLLHRHDEGELYEMETVASGMGINAEIRRLAPAYAHSILAKKAQEEIGVHLSELLDICRQGDELASRVLDNVLNTLAITLYNIQMLLDTELYVFGGGLAEDGWLLKETEKRLECLCRRFGEKWSAKLAVSQLGADRIGVLGAACLYSDAHKINNPL